MIDYKKRITSLLERIEADTFLVFNLEGTDSASMYYLTGFTGEGALIISGSETLLLTDSRYTEQVKREVPEIASKKITGNYLDAVVGTINSKSIPNLVIGSSRISHYFVETLKKRVETVIVSMKDPVQELRKVKDPEEIKRIRAAVNLTQASLSELIEGIKIGMTERQVALRLEFIMREKGAEKVAFDLIIAAGENSALPHYRPKDRKLRQGDLLLCDIGAQVDGYCSDMTRVFSIGEPPTQAKEIYNIVLQANRAGRDQVKAGATGIAVDGAARRVITDAGHADHFGHGLGHGVGIEVHESPRLSPLSKDILEAGMAATIEPGIYLPGFGGVRIEDLVIVTEEGCDVLTSFPSDCLAQIG